MAEPAVLWKHPHKRGAATPLVVLLHGRGADEHDLIDLAASLPPAFAYVSLRGFVPLDEGGYTWFRDRGVARPIPASLRIAVNGIRAWLDGPATAAYARETTFLLGFSAGMMTAGALLLDDPDRFAGTVLLSGAMALEAGFPATLDRLAGKPVFTGHGLLDTMIPEHLVTQTMDYLRERSGAKLTAREYPREHSIARREVDDIAAWLSDHA